MRRAGHIARYDANLGYYVEDPEVDNRDTYLSFEPKKDLTAFELACALEIHIRGFITMPGDVPQVPPFSRHWVRRMNEDGRRVE